MENVNGEDQGRGHGLAARRSVDNQDGTITVLLDGSAPIRHTLRADNSIIEATASPGKAGKSLRLSAIPA